MIYSAHADVQPTRTARACLLSGDHTGPHISSTSAAPNGLQLLVSQIREAEVPRSVLVPSQAQCVQSCVDVASGPHPAVATPRPICKKSITDSALRSPAPNVGRKAAFKQPSGCLKTVLELQISVETPGLLVLSLCAQLLAREVP